MVDNWFAVHMEGLNEVQRDTGIQYFRRCRIPGSDLMLTSKEFETHFANS